MKIKTKMWYHYTLTQMAKIKKIFSTKGWQRCGGTGTLLQGWWEYKIVQPLWTVCQFLKMLNIHVPYDTAILPLNIYPRKWKASVHAQIFTWMFIDALFIIASNWNNPNAHQLMNGYASYGVSVQWNTTYKS